MEINLELFKKAYKKLKSNVYFDKTCLPLRDAIVAFENDPFNTSVDDLLDRLCEDFKAENKRWNCRKQEILNSIKCVALPKKIKKPENAVFFNFNTSTSVDVSDIQYFLQMDVEGHILGVIWLLLIGWQIDRDFKYCYGNRIREKLRGELSGEPTYSPYLFEPYFEKYEGWRDGALSLAKQKMNNGEDVIVATMDFKRFYYSVDVSPKFMKSMLDKCDNGKDTLSVRINEFVYAVIKQYAKCYCKLTGEKNKKILPIGFLPSNVIANYCLTKFDRAITNGWKPDYYGRYVDDILIVDSLPKNSYLAEAAKKGELDKEKVFSYFMIQESTWKGIEEKPRGHALFKKENKQKEEDKKSYSILSEYVDFVGPGTKIVVQEEKTKFFYFQCDQSDALLTCFQENIAKNKSEFRRLPEDEAIFQKDDYSEIYQLKQDGINKFRDVNGIVLDKYQLSKFLGKSQRICNLIQDRRESHFVKDIKKVFTDEMLIENYTLWEKVFTILVVNENFEELADFIEKILEAIEKVEFKPESEMTSKIIDENCKIMKSQLKEFLCSGLNRALSLSIGNGFKGVLQNRNSTVIEKSFDISKISSEKNYYLETRMCDKTMCAVLPEVLVKMKKRHEGDMEFKVNCSDFQKVLAKLHRDDLKVDVICEKQNDQYKYFPYLVTMYDICILQQLKHMCDYDEAANDYEVLGRCKENYTRVNYDVHASVSNRIHMESKKFNENLVVRIGDKKMDTLSLAVSSIKMPPNNLEKLIMGTPNRSIERYNDISKLVNSAIEQNAQMLVMPEACVPFEWLSTLARTSARNQMAIVTGVEHICIYEKMYNYTAVILPFEYDGYRCSQIVFHLKNHYAPSELRMIRGYHMIPVEARSNGKVHYELYCWNDFWFSVYCCYELASIYDRALFQSYADALIAVEWNKDVNYYSNIMESLSRDLHCYCAQVNPAEYGDSRITQPTETVRKDILRTMGGDKPTVLTGQIMIKELREFQIKEYEIQKDDKRFKATPPQFRKEIVKKKIKGELYESLNDSN